MSPLGKFYFGNSNRFHPMSFLRLGWPGKWIAGGLEVLEDLRNLLQQCVIEAGAGIPHVDQLSLLVVQAQHEGAEILPCPFRIGIASDNAVNGLRDLDLLPIAAAAFLVTAVRLLGDDAFEPFFFGNVEKRLAVS